MVIAFSALLCWESCIKPDSPTTIWLKLSKIPYQETLIVFCTDQLLYESRTVNTENMLSILFQPYEKENSWNSLVLNSTHMPSRIFSMKEPTMMAFSAMHAVTTSTQPSKHSNRHGRYDGNKFGCKFPSLTHHQFKWWCSTTSPVETSIANKIDQCSNYDQTLPPLRMLSPLFNWWKLLHRFESSSTMCIKWFCLHFWPSLFSRFFGH